MDCHNFWLVITFSVGRKYLLWVKLCTPTRRWNRNPQGLWRQGLCEWSHEDRSVGRTLTRHASVLWKGKFEQRQTHKDREASCKPRNACGHRHWQKAWDGSPSPPSDGTLRTPRSQTPSLQYWERVSLCCLSHSVCDICYGSSGERTRDPFLKTEMPCRRSSGWQSRPRQGCSRAK